MDFQTTLLFDPQAGFLKTHTHTHTHMHTHNGSLLKEIG
jgi:hypothetical protein